MHSHKISRTLADSTWQTFLSSFRLARPHPTRRVQSLKAALPDLPLVASRTAAPRLYKALLFTVRPSVLWARWAGCIAKCGGTLVDSPVMFCQPSSSPRWLRRLQLNHREKELSHLRRPDSPPIANTIKKPDAQPGERGGALLNGFGAESRVHTAALCGTAGIWVRRGGNRQNHLGLSCMATCGTLFASFFCICQYLERH